MKNLVDFLRKCTDEAVVCNYNGNNVEQTKIFDEMQFLYDDLGKLVRLSDKDEECYPMTIRLDQVLDIHIFVDSCTIAFENGDNFEMYFE
jgi:hypothetical protein